ncbi:acetamidase [Verticillium alfalfae VaMs.102]|uniref:amidase n=1 Tax=Verticillium alfalfae (strain VaMs.102 / ATCC MYA-4576 / FGSC 10136) TaxID=526221 RepID=C9SLN3_VERA1|nr:acetamidase [Verticillium alfalfae VaMs.102]EEY19601.1 acetamidase [Verticillium alfalfae VaMs.102]
MGSVAALSIEENRSTLSSDWAALAAAHSQKQREAIPKAWTLSDDTLKEITGHGTDRHGRLVELQTAQKSGLLSDHEIGISQATASELVQKIHAGELTSAEVTVTFCKMAAVAQQTDSLHVKGRHATVGYTEYLRRDPPNKNSALVDLLLDAGAVLYCKTNVPQTMMTADSENHIFGRTLCPHKTTLTAGGSSGGEGALVGFRGSPLGVGTDIAGSIRIPSLCCGTYGFKPSSNRVPFGGQSHYPFPIHGLDLIEPTAGPLANSVADLSLFMQTVTRRSPWKYDPTAHHLGWRALPHNYAKRLTIGVLPEDPLYKLHPPVRHTIDKAVAVLKAKGHNIVHLPYEASTSVDLGGRIGFQLFTLGGPSPDQVLEEAGEPLVYSVEKRVHPFAHGGLPVPPSGDKFAETIQITKVKAAYAEAWQKTWGSFDLDVVLAPGAISTSVSHDTYGCPMYTLMWNVLDYPAGIIPYGTSSSAEFPEHQKGNATFDSDCMAASTHWHGPKNADPKIDIPEAADGAPCAIQIVAPRFHDEECLQAMELIDKELRQDAQSAHSRPRI